MKYVNSILLWLSIVVLGMWIYYEHDRITLTQDKMWKDNREQQRQDNCINYLYQRVDFGRSREEIQKKGN